jgi:hypothetical protein
VKTRPWKIAVGCLSATLLSAAFAAPSFAAPKPADDIRDIRPLIAIPPWWYWALAAIAAALLAGLIFGCVRYLRERARRALTPAQQAARALDRAAELARVGKCREWAELVSVTLRGALAAQLEREVHPDTTSELAAVDWAALARGSAVDVPTLLELLSTCDLTRFALGRLEASALLAETERARSFVSRLFAPPEPQTQSASSPPIANPNPVEAIR